jgi:hypothetical protein
VKVSLWRFVFACETLFKRMKEYQFGIFFSIFFRVLIYYIMLIIIKIIIKIILKNIIHHNTKHTYQIICLNNF